MRARLVKFPLRAGRIGQNTFRNGKNCSVYIRDWFGLVKMTLRVGKIGENSFRDKQDWLEYLWKWLCLNRICLFGPPKLTGFSQKRARSVRTGRIGQNSFRSEQDCSQFLEEQVGLA